MERLCGDVHVDHCTHMLPTTPVRLTELSSTILHIAYMHYLICRGCQIFKLNLRTPIYSTNCSLVRHRMQLQCALLVSLELVCHDKLCIHSLTMTRCGVSILSSGFLRSGSSYACHKYIRSSQVVLFAAPIEHTLVSLSHRLPAMNRSTQSKILCVLLLLSPTENWVLSVLCPTQKRLSTSSIITVAVDFLLFFQA
jgi:hypothetical protein